MAKKILYAVVVFGIMGFGLYLASTFEYYGYRQECELESTTQGGIEACIEYKAVSYTHLTLPTILRV